MSTGEKLQQVAEKVATKLGKQDAPITFRLVAKGSKAHVAAAPTVTNDDLTISSGLSIGFVTAYEVRQPGVLEVGDLRLLIPGHKVTEARLRACEIVYRSERWSIVNYSPTKLISGVPVKWQVLARRVK
jgi:hypothetical protein